jgi:hypothetical protein
MNANGKHALEQWRNTSPVSLLHDDAAILDSSELRGRWAAG